MSSAAPKNKSFDRGGPVWPPRSNAKDVRLSGGVGAKNRGIWGAAPPSPNRFFFLKPKQRKIKKAESVKRWNLFKGKVSALYTRNLVLECQGTCAMCHRVRLRHWSSEARTLKHAITVGAMIRVVPILVLFPDGFS